MSGKIIYLKSIKKENIDLINKYKKIIIQLENLENSVNNKIKREDIYLNNLKYIYSDTMSTYQNILKNLSNEN